MKTPTNNTSPQGSEPEAPSTAHIPQNHSGNSARTSWKVSLDALRRNIAHMRPAAKQALVDAFLISTKENITRHEFASAVEISENVVYKLCNGTYNHPTTGQRLDLSEKMLANIQRWVSERRAHAAKREEFVLTPTSRKVIRAYELAAESKTPVFLFGPSHIGKTWALEHISQTHNHGRTPYFRMRAAGGIMGLLKLLAQGLGVSPNSNREALKERIFAALDMNMVLLLDEMHELLFTYQKGSFFACIEFIREIHDVVGCGLVLSFTDWGRDKIYRDKHAELNQIFRRGVHRFQLPSQPLKADLEQILAANGLDFPSKSTRVDVRGIGERPYDLLRQLGKDDGLKAITERIRYARKIASKLEREDPTWEDFCHAHILITRNAQAQDDWS